MSIENGSQMSLLKDAKSFDKKNLSQTARARVAAFLLTSTILTGGAHAAVDDGSREINLDKDALDITLVFEENSVPQCHNILDNAVALKPIKTPDNPYQMHPDSRIASEVVKKPNRLMKTMFKDKNGVERYNFGKVENVTASEIIEVVEKGLDLPISKEVAQFIARGKFLNNKDTLVLEDQITELTAVLSERAVLAIYKEIFSGLSKPRYTLAEFSQLFIDGSCIDQVKDEPENKVLFVDCRTNSDKVIYYIFNNLMNEDIRRYNVSNGKTDNFPKGGENGIIFSGSLRFYPKVSSTFPIFGAKKE